jgi:hypothetical protein
MAQPAKLPHLPHERCLSVTASPVPDRAVFQSYRQCQPDAQERQAELPAMRKTSG